MSFNRNVRSAIKNISYQCGLYLVARGWLIIAQFVCIDLLPVRPWPTYQISREGLTNMNLRVSFLQQLPADTSVESISLEDTPTLALDWVSLVLGNCNKYSFKRIHSWGVLCGKLFIISESFLFSFLPSVLVGSCRRKACRTFIYPLVPALSRCSSLAVSSVIFCSTLTSWKIPF